MDSYFIKERVYYYRTKNKMSARNLSLELGMCGEYINQLETGRLKPSLDFLINFCGYFGITLSEFFDENQSFPAELNDLIAATKGLSKDSIELLTTLARTMRRG